MADTTLFYLKQQVNNYPTLEQLELVQLFDELEELIMSATHILIDFTQLIETNLLELAGQIAGGLTKGKSVYKRSLMDPRKRDTSADEVPEINPPTIAFYSSDDQEFLVNILELSRAVNRNDKPSVHAIISKLKLSRAIYEQFLEMFLKLTENYCEQTVELAQHRLTGDVQATEQLTTETLRVESLVMGDHWSLYNVRAEIQRKFDKARFLRDKTLRAYLRLAMRISQDLSQQSTNSQALDNYQSGTLGLVRAISYYDQYSGFRFASYASWWIKQSVLLHLKESANFVHLPVGTWQAYTWLETVVKPKVLAREGSITRERLKEESGYSDAQLDMIYASVKASQVFSLDYPLGDDESDTTLMSIVADDSIKAPDAPAESDTMVRVKGLLGKLSPEDLKIVCLHYGLLEHLPTVEIPVKDLARERIRQRLAWRIKHEAQ